MQAREAELEQTIQELNAALVASRKICGVAGRGSSHVIGDGSNEAEGNTNARLKVLEMDLETANSHLALERERVRKIVAHCNIPKQRADLIDFFPLLVIKG